MPAKAAGTGRKGRTASNKQRDIDAAFIESAFDTDILPEGTVDEAGERSGLLGSWVARNYFIDKKPKNKIAEELGISRFKVARLIRSAVSNGTVKIKIEIADPEGIDGDLSSRLQAAFGLRRAIVVSALPDSGTTMRAVAKAAAAAIAEMLEPDDVLGISWGSALDAMVDLLPPLPKCKIVQMAGGSSDWSFSVNAVDLVRRASLKTGAKAYAIHAPLAVATSELAVALKSEPSIAQTLSEFSSVTKAVIGIGCWMPPASTIREILPERDRAELEQLGVVGDACGSFWDSEGNSISTPLQDRLIAFRESDLRKVPELIAVTHGAERAAATYAILCAALPTTLVTDTSVAEALLRKKAEAQRSR